MRKRRRVLLVGVGGQGVLTAGIVIGNAALDEGVPILVGQLHGMSQRGGAVECSLVFGAARTAFIGPREADALIAFEPLEALRALPRVRPGATVVINREPIVPASISRTGGDYPDFPTIVARLREVAGRVVPVHAGELAREAGDARTASAVMIGVASRLGVVPVKEQAVARSSERRSPRRMVEINKRAFELGAQSVVATRRVRGGEREERVSK